MSRHYFIPLNWILTLIITLTGIYFEQYWLLVIWLVIELMAGFEVVRQQRAQGQSVWMQNFVWCWASEFIGIGNLTLSLIIYIVLEIMNIPDTKIALVIAGYGLSDLFGVIINKLIRRYEKNKYKY